MPSVFDTIFAALARPTLLATFAANIEIDVTESGGWENAQIIVAQIGRETTRRVRTGDGWKTVRAREILVAPDSVMAAYGIFDSGAVLEVLKTIHRVRIESIAYVVNGHDRAPGSMVKLMLERSDAEKIRRPNIGGRR